MLMKNIYKFGHGKKAWFLKHINDPYVKKANEANYRSRASFKLIQILSKHPKLIYKSDVDNKHKNKKITIQQIKSIPDQQLINNILDLGSAPGSWSQVMKQIIPKANIASIDLLQMKPIEGVNFYKCDAKDKSLHKILKQKYGKFQLIISDMAPNFIGDTATTHQQIIQLNLLCVQLCIELGNSACSLVMKSIQGEKQKKFYNLLSVLFQEVFREKPQSSRSESVQFFYVCEKLKKIKQPQNLKDFIENVSQNITEELQKYKTKQNAQKAIQKYLLK